MENYDLLASLNVKASATSSLNRGIVIASSSSSTDHDNKSSISAIVALRQSRRDSVSSSGTRRVNRQTNRNQLIGILTENNVNRKGSTTTRKKTVCIEPKLHRAGIVSNVVQVQLQRGGNVTSAIGGKSEILNGSNSTPGKQKIPRPANAFMLFANEWRKKLAIENPRESNKDISVRLGVLWKNMDKDIKEKYFSLAREVDAEHKRKYPAGAYGIAGGVGGAPVSDAIEANASRYNRLPPAYPTDYVYNPKEARLRKAMREQSRELSRQTILQTAIASATGNTNIGGPGCVGNGVNGNISPSSATGPNNFLNHPINCPASVVSGSSVSAATVSSLPGSPSFNTGNRIINPWFPGSHGPSANHLKPILSPRVMTVAQHQQQQQQHRTFDKTKEVLRKQAECAGVGTFSSVSSVGYPGDFSPHNNPANLSGHQSSSHDPNDYCVIAEFSDGQKWHPYQNGPSPYHSRVGGPLTKMGGMHPGLQSTNPHAHPGWNQFCTVPFSNMNRTPRHMVFLQEQQQNQHCGFPDEMQMSYMQNKHMDINHRLHSSYSQQEHQSKLQSESMSPLNMSQLREAGKPIEDGPRWETNGSSGTSEPSMSSMVIRARRENELKIHQEQDSNDPIRSQDCRQHSQTRSREREQTQQQQQQQQQQHQRYSDESSTSPSEMEHKKGSSSKQPLPGFHQAFGSTEIGRFSRSEFFANMVGDGSNLIPEGFVSASIFPFSSNPQIGICSGNSLGFPHMIPEEEILQQILPNDCIWIAPLPAHTGVSGLMDAKTSYATLHDYSHRFNQQDWLHNTGHKMSKDFQTALIEHPAGTFVLRDNNCAFFESRENQERQEYSESNCSSSSAGSINYAIGKNRTNRPNFREKSVKILEDEESIEPENLSSRSNQVNYSSNRETSSSPRNTRG